MSYDRELTCQDLVELVTEYLEATLPHAERTRFEEHLATCPGCRTYLEQMRQTIDLLNGHADKTTLPPEILRAFSEAFRGWKRDRSALREST